jgi:Mlc titration factor MtfA (ptsG expression regulator)
LWVYFCCGFCGYGGKRDVLSFLRRFIAKNIPAPPIIATRITAPNATPILTPVDRPLDWVDALDEVGFFDDAFVVEDDVVDCTEGVGVADSVDEIVGETELETEVVLDEEAAALILK